MSEAPGRPLEYGETFPVKLERKYEGQCEEVIGTRVVHLHGTASLAFTAATAALVAGFVTAAEGAATVLDEEAEATEAGGRPCGF